MDKEVIDDVKLETIRSALSLTEEGLRKAQQFLYLNLLQYTEGDSHSRTVAGGMAGSFETYRQLILKGKMRQLPV